MDGVAIGILPTEDKINYAGDNWKDNLNEIERENLIAQINLCDGIVMQGGLETDNYEMIIAKYCYENDIPILAICAGQNNLVRALGGTTCMVSDPSKHDKSFEEYVHGITINKNSKFYNIVKTEKMNVNSRHRNTVKECPLLEKVGFDDDGNADVVEAKNKKFYVGVRFHPESLYKKDKNHRKIFEEFIKNCK